ncbi:RluA family pseudouridine synthase [Virgibacillus ainsalahensis]
MKWTIEQKHEGMTIRDYLRMVQSFSRRMVKIVKFDGGKIEVNGQPQNVRFSLAAGDKLNIEFPKEEVGDNLKAEEMDLSIIFEDEAIIVIDKPAGMAVLPSFNHQSGTLANGLLGYYNKTNVPYSVHVVTRLDRDTSGLVLIAKHRLSHSLLQAALKNGKLKRKYKAVVQGYLQCRAGVVDAPIDRKENSIIERTVKDSGKKARTHFEVIRESNNHSLIEIELETGRTHQIRVHFSYLGHPLAGDDLYGGSGKFIGRQALHCMELVLEHPFSKETLKFACPLHEDMERLISSQNN